MLIFLVILSNLNNLLVAVDLFYTVEISIIRILFRANYILIKKIGVVAGNIDLKYHIKEMFIKRSDWTEKNNKKVL